MATLSKTAWKKLKMVPKLSLARKIGSRIPNVNSKLELPRTDPKVANDNRFCRDTLILL